MLCSQPPLQATAPPAHSSKRRRETNVEHREMAARKKLSLVWQCFDEEESDNKVACQLCMQKLTHNQSTGAMRNHTELRNQDIKPALTRVQQLYGCAPLKHIQFFIISSFHHFQTGSVDFKLAMARCCVWGTFKSDACYLARFEGYTFYTFPKSIPLS